MGGGRPAHGERPIHSKHPVTAPLQVTGDPALAAADVEGQPTGCGDERYETLPVEPPVAVRPIRGPDPVNPFFGVRIPRIAEHG
jgi:hypothetical protein